MKSTTRICRLLAAAALAIAATACTQVSTGEVGVKSTLGKVSLVELNPGVYETVTKSVTVVSVRETTVPLENVAGAKTKDNVTMQDVDVDIRYSTVPDKVADTIAKLAGDTGKNANGDVVVGEKFVTRVAREAVLDSVKQFKADEVHLKREDITGLIASKLQAELDKEMPGTFTIHGVTARALVTDKKLEQAIRDAAQVQFDIQKRLEQKALVEAEGQILLQRATDEAAANAKIAASLTPALLRKMELEAQAAFAKEGTHTVVLGNGGNSGVLLNAK